MWSKLKMWWRFRRARRFIYDLHYYQETTIYVPAKLRDELIEWLMYDRRYIETQAMGNGRECLLIDGKLVEREEFK